MNGNQNPSPIRYSAPSPMDQQTRAHRINRIGNNCQEIDLRQYAHIIARARQLGTIR